MFLPRLRNAAGAIPRRAHVAPLSWSSRTFSVHSDKTHFGFKTVEKTEKAALVGEVFRNVAQKYDIMNDVMSGSLHRYWKDEFVRMAGPVLSKGDQETVCLDVAGGTGDIAFRIVEGMKSSFIQPKYPPVVIVTDINPAMLGVGEERARSLGYLDDATMHAGKSAVSNPKVIFRQGDAENLHWVPDNSVDLYTIAFGIRNVTHVDRALAEAYRVLRPGGRFMCLEFSHVTMPLLAQLYDAYSFNVIPAMGAAIANDREAYQYLVESIRNFPDQETFADMICDAGFSGVGYTNFTFGVCAVHTGYKLPEVESEELETVESTIATGSNAGPIVSEPQTV